MRWSRYVLVAVAALLVVTGCARPARHASAPSRSVQLRYRCPVPFNAGGRIPGVLNPAYPRTGLYPASGAIPPADAPGVMLRMQAAALVVTYGQPLETAGTNVHGSMVAATQDGRWWVAPLVAGYTFRLFGPAVPVFGVIPAPVLSGTHAAHIRYVWMVTQWDMAQTLTVLRGNTTIASVAQSWHMLPGESAATDAEQAAAYVRQAEGDGWQAVGSFAAKPACGASADQLSAFGARAALKLPLNEPLQLVSPEFGGVVMELTAD